MVALEWWKQPIRMMRYEWGYDLARVRDMDPVALARMIRERFHCNVDTANATCGIPPAADSEGGMSTVTFAAPGYRPYPGLEGSDWLRQWVAVAHNCGLKVVPYVNLHWFSYSFGEKYPGWLQRLPDGRPYGEVYPLYGNGTTMCVNSPWRDWAFGLLEALAGTGADGAFLDGPVVFPDCCYCPSCQAQFKQRYGHELPLSMDWSSQVWKDFIAFREDSLAEFMRDARASFRRVNPTGVVFCNAGTFRPGAWRVARNIERLQPSQDISGAEAFIHPMAPGLPLHFSDLTGKYERAGDLPGMVFMHHTYGSYHYVPLTPQEMELALAQTCAVGARVYVIVWHDAMENAAEETASPMEPLALQERHEELWLGAESGAEIAILASSATLHYYVSRLQAIYAEGGSAIEANLIADMTGTEHIDWAARKNISDQIVTLAYEGWYNALTRNHFQFDVLLDSKVTEENLRKYQVLILPNSACLSNAQLAAIRAFSERGGALIASFEAGVYDERGNLRSEWTLGKQLGVERLIGSFAVAKAEEYTQLLADSALAVGLGKGKRLPRAYYAALVESNLPPAAVYLQPTGGLYRPLREPSDRPSVLLQESPRTVYLAEELGHAYSVLKAPWHEVLLRNVVLFALGREPVVTTDGPKTLQVELWRQPSRLILHLVNNASDGQRPIAERLPLPGFTLAVRCERKPERVWAAATDSDLPYAWQDGRLYIKVGGLDLYDIVVIEL